ncbi:hydroxysqualene dehydroxylase HpnE [Glaciimonas immobilis]|uniref:Squalene-associated FAD-dependent desaturase n=1 Tax=Glaciimonas immobilis TaxID=728004 RepID=A0A840RNZ3_9BURK|nr:hydroxysqualene dehydroxylase HpnE [Glaciimonas immobilis]KAF3998957.1 FAD-dependent oxidoreductase [Glaciimonas immobilis]MBB5198370.1 squalene-associated FAD-dependent desaturase [Glaciimonas immobilis]
MSVPRKKIAVIGAGWAGCSAAVALSSSAKRHQVTLFEASRVLGGRARSVTSDVPASATASGHTMTHDNGQHILLGAYKQTLQLMRKVGVDPAATLLRLPLQMCYPVGSGGITFQAPRLPAPLHLLAALWRAQGLTRADKLALARFNSAARWMGWQLHDDCSVSTLLERFDQTERLTQLLWSPLCIAALNTPPERASAQVFLAVLRDSLGARRAASDMLLPRVALSNLLPNSAATYIAQAGGSVRLGCNIRQLQANGSQWRVSTTESVGDFDAVVIATPPDTAAKLLDDLTDTTLLQGFTYEPITTCYLRYASTIFLSRPFMALIENRSKGHWGQFVFDRGQLDSTQAGLLAVVLSSSAAAIGDGHAILCKGIAEQLAEVFKLPELAHPHWTKVISEKRATFACTPALARPSNSSGLAGVWLAGDYTISDYPATLESAVRSGNQAAKELDLV